VNEEIIDIRKYLGASRETPGRAFAVWGGEGEKARFALPVWRALFLVGGSRGGIYRIDGGSAGGVVPFFVLDLGQEPARTSFEHPPPEAGAAADPPHLMTRPDGGVLVFLGEDEGRRWFLEVGGGGEGETLTGRRREELLFLAGECAGLLFFRNFAEGTV
jgi:hypothetical protein